jgi:hypothetical protein
MAEPVRVDVFTRAESVELVRRVLRSLPVGDAERLAETLGDLPLALTQAVGLMEETRMPVAEYLAELEAHAREVLAEGRPLGYPATLAASVELSVRRVRDSAAVELLHLCANLAPEPIPLAWLTDSPSFGFRRSVGRLARLGLARITDETIQLHRLTQAVLRDLRTPEERLQDKKRVEDLLAAAEPDQDGSDPRSWPAWAALVPHLLAFDLAGAEFPLRTTASFALWYLLMRGEYATTVPLAESLHQQWLSRLGPDDEHTRMAARVEAHARRWVGDNTRARILFEDLLARNRQALGEDHLNTLISANDLANVLDTLGEHAQARPLTEDTLARFRQLLGEDHRRTLVAAGIHSKMLYELGQHQQALTLAEDTLARLRRTLGDDHPETLQAANNVAVYLMKVGDLDGAAALLEESLTGRRRVLGEDHPDTRVTAENLAICKVRMAG